MIKNMLLIGFFIFFFSCYTRNEDNLPPEKNIGVCKVEYDCNSFDISKIGQFSDSSMCQLFLLYDEECHPKASYFEEFIRLTIFSKMRENYILNYVNRKECILYKKKIIPPAGLNLFSYNMNNIKVEYSVTKEIIPQEYNMEYSIDTLSSFFIDSPPQGEFSKVYMLEFYINGKYDILYSSDLITNQQSKIIEQYFPIK